MEREKRKYAAPEICSWEMMDQPADSLTYITVFSKYYSVTSMLLELGLFYYSRILQ